MSNASLKALLPLSVCAAAALAPAPVSALDNYMKLGDIRGTVDEKDYVDQIEIISWAWGGSNRFQPPNGAWLRAGRPNLTAISVVKGQDKSTGPIVAATASAQRFNTIEIATVDTAADSTLTEYNKIILKNAIISSVSVGSGDGESPLETITLVYECVTLTYTPVDGQGKPKDPITSGYDVISGETLEKC